MSLFKVGCVIFPDLTQLDFTGPQQVLARLPDSAMHMSLRARTRCRVIAASASCRRTPLRTALTWI